MKNNKNANSIVFVIMIVVGAFMLILGAGNFFVRGQLIGMFTMMSGAFVAGVGLYRIINPPVKK